jgi:hypothetical protein
MGLRALARRSRGASMTVLGDLAQATAPAAQVSWEAAIAHLGAPPTAQRADLDLGYRVPASIMDMANGLLATAAPDVTPCRSVRVAGRELRRGRRPADAEHDDEALASAVHRAVAEVAGTPPRWPVAPASVRAAIDGAASAGTGDRARPARRQGPGIRRRRRGRAGRHRRRLGLGLRLYVALTRAVQELVVVHARPLPPGLRLDRPAAHRASSPLVA